MRNAAYGSLTTAPERGASCPSACMEGFFCGCAARQAPAALLSLARRVHGGRGVRFHDENLSLCRAVSVRRCRSSGPRHPRGGLAEAWHGPGAAALPYSRTGAASAVPEDPRDV